MMSGASFLCNLPPFRYGILFTVNLISSAAISDSRSLWCHFCPFSSKTFYSERISFYCLQPSVLTVDDFAGWFHYCLCIPPLSENMLIIPTSDVISKFDLGLIILTEKKMAGSVFCAAKFPLNIPIVQQNSH